MSLFTRFTWLIIGLCAIWSAFAQTPATEDDLNIYHRLIIPGREPGPFSQRAVLKRGVTYTPTPDFHKQVATFLEQSGGDPRALYQVALQRPWDRTEEDWSVSSVKLCYLTETTWDTLFVHLSKDNAPYAVDYFVSPTQPSGKCPENAAGAKASSWDNTSVSFKTPNYAPEPEWRAPPELAPDGQRVKPKPKPSFLAKYGFYILGGLVVISFLTPAPEEGGGGSQQ